MCIYTKCTVPRKSDLWFYFSSNSLKQIHFYVWFNDMFSLFISAWTFLCWLRSFSFQRKAFWVVFCWSCATHMIWISPRKQTKNVDKRAKNRIKLKWRAVWKDVGAFLVKNFESYVGQLILEEGKLRKIVCCKSVSLLSLLKYIETSIRPVFFKKRIIP